MKQTKRVNPAWSSPEGFLKAEMVTTKTERRAPILEGITKRKRSTSTAPEKKKILIKQMGKQKGGR